ncbi:hypothetical protein D3C86_1234420 [compost metagenome]
MMTRYFGEHRPDSLRIEPLLAIQHHRLIPMMHLLHILLEEPALNGQQLYVPFYRPLISLR